MSNRGPTLLTHPVHRSPLWTTIRRNGTMKLFCLALAFIVWQSVRERTRFEALVSDIPVAVTPGEGRAILEQSTDVVSIRFRGSRDDLRFISRDQVEVKLDLSEQKTDRLRRTLKFTPRYVKAPLRVHAVEFNPPEISITLDREVERILPVRVAFDGDLPPGIQMEKNLCTPDCVTVRGAERLLSELEQVRTAPISLDGRYHSFKTHVPVAAADSSWTVLPERVRVEALLVERVETRRIENSTVRPLLVADDTRVVKIRPGQVTVTLRGSPQRIEELTPQDVYTYVDCTGLTEPADYEVSVRADLPPGVQIEQIEPATVRVTVKKM